MKSKKTLITIVIAVLVMAVAAVLISNRISSVFEIHNNEDNSVSIIAQKAGKDAGGIGYITLEEDQEIKVRANLTDKSSIRIEVLPGNADSSADVLMEETFTAVDVRRFELPAGDYILRITAGKGADGTMDITAE